MTVCLILSQIFYCLVDQINFCEKLKRSQKGGFMIQDKKNVIFTELFEIISGLLIHCFNYCFEISINYRVDNITQLETYHNFHFRIPFRA